MLDIATIPSWEAEFMLYLTTMQKPVFNAAVIFHLTHFKTSSAILLWLGIGDTEPSSLSRINQ